MIESEVSLSKFLAETLADQNEIDQLVLKMFRSGGKKVRLKLTLFVAERLGVDPALALSWAACNEVLHNASLIHDDIQDQDLWRRGQPTMWYQHGLDVAVSAGDYLLMKPFLLIGQMKTSDTNKLYLMNLIAKSVSKMALAQLEERKLVKHLKMGHLRELYLNVASGKTSTLFELPIQGLLQLSSRHSSLSDEQNLRWKSAFNGLGNYFQIWDDLRDLLGIKGKPYVGSDLIEKKVSAAMVVWLEENSERITELESFLAKKENQPAEVSFWLQEFRHPEVLAGLQMWLKETWANFNALLPELLVEAQFAEQVMEWLQVPNLQKQVSHGS